MCSDANHNELSILSNNHVIALNRVGGRIAQPGCLDDSAAAAANVIATVQDPLPAICQLGGNLNPGDFALALVGNNTLVSAATPPEMVALKDRKPLDPALAGLKKVRKAGRRTGVTHGIVRGPAINLSLEYEEMNAQFKFQDQLLVQSTEPGKPFADESDSGSLVVTEDGQAIGLVFAAAGNTGDAIVCPLKQMFDLLGISFVLPK